MVTAENYEAWVGREIEKIDTIDTHRVAGLSAILDKNYKIPTPGSPLPPCWHWAFCNDVVPQSQLGVDGHPERGGFLPDLKLPRRMWAGSKVQINQSLRVGDTVTKRSKILSITPKSGKSGQLFFVSIKHEWFVGDKLSIKEDQDIVYRDMPRKINSNSSGITAPSKSLWRREIKPDPVLLFRYSALTFNGHRIHYDQPYCISEEGYPGLVVHGPLIATFLLDLCRHSNPEREISRFSFRAVSPLFDQSPFFISGSLTDDGNAADLWAENAEGYISSKAKVEMKG